MPTKTKPLPKPVTLGAAQRIRALSGELACDIETYDPDGFTNARGKVKAPAALDAFRGKIRLIQLADERGRVLIIDWRALEDGPEAQAVAEALSERHLIVHNAAFELLWFRRHLGIRPLRVWDTMIASRLITCGSDERGNGLGEVLERELAVYTPKTLGASDWGTLFLDDAQIEYAANDVVYLHRLKECLAEKLREAGMEKVFRLESLLLPIVVQMVEDGFAVDVEALKALRESEEQEARQHEVTLRQVLEDPKLNAGSTKQLLDTLRSNGFKLEDTKEVTLALHPHQVTNLILDHRAAGAVAAKAQELLDHVRDDGRIHPDFDQVGAETGRFTCRRPALQNVPRSKAVRSCFVPGSPEKRLVAADFSQIELRIASVVAPDERMLEAFREGRDLHAETARVVLRKPADQPISKADRTKAKCIAFGLLYGMGPESLVLYARTTYNVVLTYDEAKALRERFFSYYQGLAQWHKAAKEAGWTTAEGYTRLGRRRWRKEISYEWWDGFTLLTNHLVQGTAADVLKAAMIALSQELPSHAKLVACIHDELLLEADAHEAEAVRALTSRVMEASAQRVLKCDIPILAEARVCQTWADK
jgi:DNA polymerase I